MDTLTVLSKKTFRIVAFPHMTKIIVFANFNPVRFLGKATKRGRLQCYIITMIMAFTQQVKLPKALGLLIKPNYRTIKQNNLLYCFLI